MLWHPLFGTFKVPRGPIRAIEVGLLLVVHPTLGEMAQIRKQRKYWTKHWDWDWDWDENIGSVGNI